MIEVTLAFAPDNKTQLITTLELPYSATTRQAVQKSGWLNQYPEISKYEVGIFSQKVSWEHQLKTGDRVEIYRPLTINPQQKRQKLLEKRVKAN